MSTICLFYATKNDVLSVTEQVESALSIRYVRYGRTSKLPPECFESAAFISNLGIASHPSAVGCEKFLVCETQTIIKPERLKILTEEDVERSFVTDKSSLRSLIGKERFAIDQLDNPDTITFTAGGIWKHDILLHGGIGTASESVLSKALMKRFKTEIKRKFMKVRAFYVGPEALELLKNGKRLAISAQTPPEFDLAIE